MSSTRTQVYLTPDQRRAIESIMVREQVTLARVVRDALDAYLRTHSPDPESALEATFGALPDFEVPSRHEWDRG